MHSSFDVVVVGAGLAGLRAAQVLEAHGHEVLLLDKAPCVGGRLASRKVNGFVIDEGFQLINPAYPELAATGVLERFDLRSFPPVVQFAGASPFTLADPRRHPITALRAAATRTYSPRDLARAARLMGRCGFLPVRTILDEPDTSTREGLTREGISPLMIDNLFAPFLSGTVLDNTLETSWRYVQLLLRSFVLGRPGTHPRGVVALAEALRGQLRTTTVQLGEEVTQVHPGSVTTTHDTYGARAVVVATDAHDASSFVATPPTTWKGQTTWWLATPTLPDPGTLRIDLEHRPFSSALTLSAVAPERAPVNRSLVAVCANGRRDDTPDDEARSYAARVYGLDLADVAVVERTTVDRALPSVGVPLRLARSQRRGDLFVAGDYLQTSSIQGALVSGRRAAHVVLADLAGKVTPGPDAQSRR